MAVLINGVAGERLDPLDRGLQYGDGVFETIAALDGRGRFADCHFERLAEGARRLGLPRPDPVMLRAQVAAAWPRGRGVVKLIWTRGPAGRGYRPPPDAQPTCIAAGFDWPAWPATAWSDGVRLRYCRTRWSRNPLLAGIKHLNRLEQVMARAEWNDEGIAEGLMLDDREQVISGTQSNLFAVISGRIVTPDLDQCGVAGVMRRAFCSWAAEHATVVTERSIRAGELGAATELFVTNALIGAWPVCELAGKRMPGGSLAAQFNDWLRGQE